jgi:transcriptional regulator with XRE-family HTH domain
MDDKEKERLERLKLQKRFGQHLIALRKSKGITPAELARNCDMERSNIARLEAGERNPSLHILKKLATGLGVSVSALLKDFE